MPRKYYSLSLISFICFFSLLFVHANSQIPSDTTSIYPQPFLIESKKVIGEWRGIDSVNYNIEFVDSLWEVTLKVKNSNPYYFSKDSTGNILSSGFFPLWPPLNCDLYFLSNDTLKLTYSVAGGTGESFLYIKSRR